MVRWRPSLWRYGGLVLGEMEAQSLERWRHSLGRDGGLALVENINWWLILGVRGLARGSYWQKGVLMKTHIGRSNEFLILAESALNRGSSWKRK